MFFMKTFVLSPRPKKDTKKSLTIRLSKADMNFIRYVADKAGRNMTVVIEAALDSLRKELKYEKTV